MKILLESIFIENIVLNFILLKETVYLSKQKAKNKNLILGAFVGATYIVIMLYLKINILNYVIFKLLLVGVIIYVSFIPNNVRKYLKLILMFFVVSIVNVGTLIVIKQIFNIEVIKNWLKIVIYGINFCFSKFVFMKLWNVYKNEITKRELIYNVEIKIGKNKYSYRAFLDTGNTVYSHGLPIIFANQDIKEMNLRDVENFEVQTVTLGNVTYKTAYVFDNILIYNKENVWKVRSGVVFEPYKITNNNYNMILNYTLFTDDLGGIKI